MLIISLIGYHISNMFEHKNRGASAPLPYSSGGIPSISGLLDDLRYYAGAYCSSAFSDSETQSLFDSDWCN